MPVSYHFILHEHNAFVILAKYLITFFLNQSVTLLCIVSFALYLFAQ